MSPYGGRQYGLAPTPVAFRIFDSFATIWLNCLAGLIGPEPVETPVNEG